jgi:hypothetical protein
MQPSRCPNEQKNRHVQHAHMHLLPSMVGTPCYLLNDLHSFATCCNDQVTALGQPKLLERVSDSLNAVHNLFRRFDEDLNGVVTRDEFEKVRHATWSVSSACLTPLPLQGQLAVQGTIAGDPWSACPRHQC